MLEDAAGIRRVVLACGKVDLRKGIDGLATPPILNKMGYLDDEIKEVCFYLRHHDDFISWVLPEEEYDRENKFLVEITNDNLRRHIEKVNKKTIDDGYLPDIQNWRNLLELCYADAAAQAELVVQDGGIIDTKKHKLQKIIALQKCLT